MVAQSEARVLVVSADLVPLARQIAAGAPSIERLVVIDASDVVADRHAGRSHGVRARAAAGAGARHE